MGPAPAKSFRVHLDPDLRQALDERAAEEERPAAVVLRPRPIVSPIRFRDRAVRVDPMSEGAPG